MRFNRKWESKDSVTTRDMLRDVYLIWRAMGIYREIWTKEKHGWNGFTKMALATMWKWTEVLASWVGLPFLENSLGILSLGQEAQPWSSLISWCLMLSTCTDELVRMRYCSCSREMLSNETGSSRMRRSQQGMSPGSTGGLQDCSQRTNWGRQEQGPKVWVRGKASYAWGNPIAGQTTLCPVMNSMHSFSVGVWGEVHCGCQVYQR